MNKKNRSAGLSKVPTGIPGFDQLTRGGLPANRTTLVVGGPGSGKTVFALQALVGGAQRGEPGIFVSFSENPRQVVENGSSFGWDLAGLEKDKLIFLDAQARPSIVKSGHFDLSGMLAGLHATATETGARRIVFDSFDLLLTLLDERGAEMQEVFRLRDWLLENDFTILITANLEGSESLAAQRFALLQFIADCAVALSSRVSEGAVTRHLRVLKYRGSGFVENEVQFGIGDSGFEVMFPGTGESGRAGRMHPEIESARKELTARVQALDRFLEMKQAELDFLLEKGAARGGVEDARRKGRAVGRAARMAGKSPVH